MRSRPRLSPFCFLLLMIMVTTVTLLQKREDDEEMVVVVVSVLSVRALIRMRHLVIVRQTRDEGQMVSMSNKRAVLHIGSTLRTFLFKLQDVATTQASVLRTVILASWSPSCFTAMSNTLSSLRTVHELFFSWSIGFLAKKISSSPTS